jgi:DNA-binding transcriptional MerR regulator
MSESELLSIGRFARLTGLSIRALRHYDEVGLLTPAEVSQDTGYRFYRREQADAARLIARLPDAAHPSSAEPGGPNEHHHRQA